MIADEAGDLSRGRCWLAIPSADPPRLAAGAPSGRGADPVGRSKRSGENVIWIREPLFAPVLIGLDQRATSVVSFHLMEIGAPMAAEKASTQPKRVGRPKAEVRPTPVTTLFDPDLLAAIERARVRREKANPGLEVTTSATVRALILRALVLEEGGETQPELPLTVMPEASTKKS